MRRCWLLVCLLLLLGCSLAPTNTIDPQATQTREVEVGLLTQVAGTVAAFSGTPVVSRTATSRAATATGATPRATAPIAFATGTVSSAVVPLPSTSGSAPTPGRPAPTLATGRPAPTKPSLPAFADLALDERRERLYGIDPLGGKLYALALADLQTVGTVDLGQASNPVAVSLSPDGAELAVGLTGSGHVALIDPERLTITGRLYTTLSNNGSTTQGKVIYAAPGLLYSVGNPGVQLFDTRARTEIGRSKYPDYPSASAALALASDGALFIGESGGSPNQLLRYALDGTTPKQVARGPHGPVSASDIAVRPDGSAVYTAGGQVWTGNLQSQLGSFIAKGRRIIYVAATDRLFVCLDATVAEVEATGNYNVVASHAVSATARVARANAAGTRLYVSTDAGLDVIALATAAR